MYEQLGALVPSPLSCRSLQFEGLGDELTGHRHLQGQEPRVQGCRRQGRSGRLRTWVKIVPVRADGGDGRGQERGMEEGLEGTRPLGVDLVQAMDRLV
jgi:hypothetical protein